MIERVPMNKNATGTRYRVSLIKCPSCGRDLGGPGQKASAHLHADHEPEDFGLTPMERGV